MEKINDNEQLKNLIPQKQILVCINKKEGNSTLCAEKGSEEILQKFKQYVMDHQLKPKVKVSKVMCLGFCGQGPIVAVWPENVWYKEVSLKDVDKIIEKHVKS